MKNLIETIKNIWRIEELRNRILITLGLLLVYRIGSFIVLPGVDSARLAATGPGGGGGIVEILDLHGRCVHSRQHLRLGYHAVHLSFHHHAAGRHRGAFGAEDAARGERSSEDQPVDALPHHPDLRVPSSSYIYATIDAAARPDSQFWLFTSIVILTCSTLFVMWLGERITERGLGNGISLIIMIGIIAQLPQAFAQEAVGRMGPGGGGPVLLLVEVVLWVLIIAGCILLVQGTRRIPVQFAKRVQGNKQYGGVRNYIPLKVNAAGVMPIIFAQAIVLVPMYLAQAFDNPPQWLVSIANSQGFFYNFTLFVMVVAFTYFYTAITVNPNQLADDMKRNGGFIPGVKPGKSTAGHIDELLSRITLPGAIFLGLVAILPAFVGMAGVKQGFAQFFGGTSLLIMVGVLLDTLQQIESHLLMRHYDGLMKSGRIKGRSGGAAYGMAG